MSAILPVLFDCRILSQSESVSWIAIVLFDAGQLLQLAGYVVPPGERFQVHFVLSHCAVQDGIQLREESMIDGGKQMMQSVMSKVGQGEKMGLP